MPSALKLTGVVVRTVDYGEADRMVTLFTRERGVVSAAAPRARTSRRRFGGALEPFTLLSAEARERGADRLVLESVSVIRGFGTLRTDLARIACASYAAELARALVREAEPHPALLELLLDYLGRLDEGPARPTALRAFELGALSAAGLQPRLADCARCGGELGGETSLRLDPAEGGVLCPSCALAASPGSPVLAASTAAELSRLQQSGLAGAEAAPLSHGAGREARHALSTFIEHQLGRRLRSRAFLDEVGPMLGDAGAPSPEVRRSSVLTSGETAPTVPGPGAPGRRSRGGGS